MKLLILSDSHGNIDNMARTVELIQPRHILHLGDCLRDAQALHERYPDIPMDTVPGNCDWGSFDTPERLLEFDGVRVLMMHGHTHRPLVDYDGMLYTMNPGAVGDYRRPTYGVLTIENGRADCAVFVLK